MYITQFMLIFILPISDPVKKWKATQAKLEAAMMEDAPPTDGDSDSDR